MAHNPFGADASSLRPNLQKAASSRSLVSIVIFNLRAVTTNAHKSNVEDTPERQAKSTEPTYIVSAILVPVPARLQPESVIGLSKGIRHAHVTPLDTHHGAVTFPPLTR